MSAIQLIRHAESEGNAGLPTNDPASIPLTQRGHEQAAALAATFSTAPDLIVVSPYLRTQQTAAPLIARFPCVSVEEWAVQEFTYLNPMKYIGTTEAQRGNSAAGYWQRCDPHWNDGGGAESFADLIARIDALETRLRQYVGKSVVIFSHGYFIKALGLRQEQRQAPVDERLMAVFRETRRCDPLPNTGRKNIEFCQAKSGFFSR
jgi:2,3-bisphosphoglycerate-dependent phosphoglycerate mutase